MGESWKPPYHKLRDPDTFEKEMRKTTGGCGCLSSEVAPVGGDLDFGKALGQVALGCDGGQPGAQRFPLLCPIVISDDWVTEQDTKLQSRRFNAINSILCAAICPMGVRRCSLSLHSYESRSNITKMRSGCPQSAHNLLLDGRKATLQGPPRLLHRLRLQEC